MAYSAPIYKIITFESEDIMAASPGEDVFFPAGLNFDSDRSSSVNASDILG
ncbi:MAG: hypothetical protein IJ309_06490 [Clostridia bacterium]|nr:hypothetical protein [Clostridia bacterium]